MAAPVEALTHDGSDSSYEEEASSTTSLASSVYAYEIEHGRSYHSYHSGKYVMPNDEEEKDRLDITYHAWRLLFDNKLCFAPIGENPQKVIDIGTGTGIWVMDFGDKYPSSQVIGTDLSPIQPRFVPPNVQFEIHDCTELPWSYTPDSFDLVHTRIMNGFGIRDWPEFYKEAFKVIKPGGFVESQEFDLITLSDDGSLSPSSAIEQWCSLLTSGALSGGIQLRLQPSELKTAMEGAGFVDVKVHEFKLPIGLWPAEARLREAGKFALGSMLAGLHGISLAIFTRFLKWDVDEMDVLLERVRNEWKLRAVHSYWPVFAVYGKKPETGAATTTTTAGTTAATTMTDTTGAAAATTTTAETPAVAATETSTAAEPAGAAETTKST